MSDWDDFVYFWATNRRDKAVEMEGAEVVVVDSLWNWSSTHSRTRHTHPPVPRQTRGRGEDCGLCSNLYHLLDLPAVWNGNATHYRRHDCYLISNLAVGLGGRRAARPGKDFDGETGERRVDR